jgi:CRP-like cAMP-binding protein
MVLLEAPSELRLRLAAVGTAIRCSAGEFLFRRGDPLKGVFLICSGAVRLGLEHDPVSFPSRVAEPGSVLGLPATLSGSPYSLTAEALEESKLIFVSQESLLGLMRDQHNLCFDVMRILTEELAATRVGLERVRKVGS